MRPILGQNGRPGAAGRRALLTTAPLALLSALGSAPALAASDGQLATAFQNGNIVVLSALACGGVALAVAAGLWALAEQRNARRLARSLRAVGAKAKAALGERDALLGAGREALVVWGRDGSGPFSYNGGDEQLQSCLRGAEALALSGAIATGSGALRVSGRNSSTHREMRWLSLMRGANATRRAPFVSPRASRATSAANAMGTFGLVAAFASGTASDASFVKHAADSVETPPACSVASAARSTAVARLSPTSTSARTAAP